MQEIMMQRIAAFGAVLCVVFLFCSCDSGLSKSQAQSVLTESKEFADWRPKFSATPKSFDKPECKDIIAKNNVGWSQGDDMELTDKGKQYFVEPPSADWCYVTYPSCDYQLKAKPEIQEITDVRESGEDRVVEFKYRFADYPADLARCIPDNGNHAGKAMLSKAGGSWKIAELK